MMNFEIKPGLGVNSLCFGMKVEEVRRELGAKFTTFKRTPDSVFPCDFFTELGVFAYYQVGGVLEALEFAEPANPLFEGKCLIGISAREAQECLEIFDSELEIDSAGVISHQLGVGIYAPGLDEDEHEKVESVIVFGKGYY
jgi:hypothetical protein